MAGLPPGDPQLVSMIVSHLKTQGLFDQFRRDCLADVDTKPAYLNLKQRVDNFVSNHLSNHTWSPQLNKNQLRNNIRQLVLQSGMLEQGVDRIVAQVVDPKVNHIFRPQVEKVVRQFLSPGTSSVDPPEAMPSPETNADAVVPQQASSSVPTSTPATDAMSILDVITSLNQEANSRTPEKVLKALDELVEDGEQDMSLDEEEDKKTEQEQEEEAKTGAEGQELEVKTDGPPDQMDVGKEISTEEKRIEEEEPQAEDQAEEKSKEGEKPTGKPSEEKQEEDSCQAKQKAKERIKEEYSLEDSDLDGLSDITVSSVHTSDLSSFEGESEEEVPLSDSSEEGERTLDGENSDKRETSEETGEEGKESKPRRKAYVHKPFLYSRYYSDSDDEVTVEERRRSVAKDKEERLLKRQQNRERMEEKRKQKAAQSEEQDQIKHKSGLSAGLVTPRAKEARKERKVLEKKVALSRKRKLDSRSEGDVTNGKKEAGETSKKPEVKSTQLRNLQQKMVKNLSDSSVPDEKHSKISGSGNVSEDPGDAKKLLDKSRTHSFILDLELGSQEALRQRSVGKFDRPPRKERKEKERCVSEELPKLKQKQEKKSEPQINESQQKDGVPGKPPSSDEKSEKKPRVKNEKKMTGAKEQKQSVSEVDDPLAKRMRAQSVEKDKSREKDKIKEKERVKGEKTAAISESKQPLWPDSSGSLEDRPEVGVVGADSAKKKEKHSKDILKRSKSHSEDRQGDKPKLKMENKEKPQAEQPNKTLADGDKRINTAEKGKTTEKSKSREEPKSHTHLKTEKKTHALDIRGASGVGKPEKEKKKEATLKEQRRSSEEQDVKSTRKKGDKKEKAKKEESHEKEAPREDKVENSDFSLGVEAEDAQMKATHSEAVAATSSDDSREPLIHIAPEGETQVREIPHVPPEADALLTLMDVCTSAMDASLHSVASREHTPLQVTLRDADMKMKEAALTLLSMDPDSALSPSFMNHRLKEESEEAVSEETKPKPQEEPQSAGDVSKTCELSPFASQTVKIDVDKSNSEEKSEMDATSAHIPVWPAFQDDDTQPNGLPSDQDEAKDGERAADTKPADKEPTPADEHPDDAGTGNLQQNAAVPPCEAPTLEHVSSPQDHTDSDVVRQMGTKVEEVLDEEQMDVTYGKLDVKNQEEDCSTQTVQLCAPPIAVREPTSGTEEAKQESETIDVHETAKESEVSDKQERGRGARKRKLSSQNAAAVNEYSEEQDAKEPSSEEAEQLKVVKEKTPRRGRSSKTVEHVEEEPPKQLEKREQTPSRRGRRSAAKGHFSDEPAVKKRRRFLKGGEPKEGDEMIKNTSEEALMGTCEETPKDTCKDSIVETSEEATRDTSVETVESTNKETIKDTSEEDVLVTNEEPTKHTSEAVTKITSEETIKDVSEEATMQNNEDVTEDVGKDSTKDASEKGTTEKNEEVLKDLNKEDIMDTSDGYKSEEAINEDASADTYEEPIKNTSEEAVKAQGEDQQIGQNIVSPTEGHKEAKEGSGTENRPNDVDGQPGATPKKPARRGRPPKAATSSDDLEKKDKKTREKEMEDDEDEKEGDGKETKGRATTRLASRLEAERNKPSKPSTRASRQSGKDENAAGARGTRGQATVTKGVRKLEASPPAVRTRGGQKSEEPPAKRGKR